MSGAIPPQQLFLLSELSGRAVANPNGRAASASWLEPLQLRWIEEYKVDLNATQAAIRAGYSEKTARQAGSKNLNNVVVMSELKRQLEDSVRGAQLSFEGLMEQLRKLAFADTRMIFTEDDQVRSPKEWPDDISVRIAGFEVEELFAGAGKTRRQIGIVKKVKFYNPNDALTTIARYLELIATGKGKPQDQGDAAHATKSDDQLMSEALQIAGRVTENVA